MQYYLTARVLIYWSGINRDIKYYIKQCLKLIKLLLALPADPLINHSVPQGHLQKISANLLDWDKERYLLVIDYFSKYPFLFYMSSMTAPAVIDCLTELFAHGGMPIQIFMDNEQTSTPRNGTPSWISMASNIPLQAYTALSPTDSLASNI